MNRKEEQTLKQEALRFSKDVHIMAAGETGLRIELPYMNIDQRPIYFFVVKRKGEKKFSLVIPVESTGLVAVNDTLARLQLLLRTYGILLSPEAVIMEESSLPLHKRIKTMAQALVAIDGIRRLWKVEYQRSPHAAESQDSKSSSNASLNRPSR